MNARSHQTSDFLASRLRLRGFSFVKTLLRFCTLALLWLCLREIGAANERMNDGSGKSISGIIGLRNSFEAKMNADHLLNLGLMGHTIAADGAFDLVRTIFVNWEMGLFRD